MQVRDAMKRGDRTTVAEPVKLFPNSGILKSSETDWSWAL